MFWSLQASHGVGTFLVLTSCSRLKKLSLLLDRTPSLAAVTLPTLFTNMGMERGRASPHDGTGQPVEQNSPSAHTVKEQFAREEHRDIASFNTDNEFNRAINEENIDFNIPGLPHSAVKRSHGVNVQNLIQNIENHPQRRALQSDLQQHRQFNPFSKESRDVIKAAGNTEPCELLDVEPKAQCKACLACWDAGIVYCTCGHFLRDDTTENKKYIKFTLDLFSIPNYYIKKGRPHGQRSIVYLATPQESRGSGSLPKLVAKLFLILVELARFPVAFFI